MRIACLGWGSLIWKWHPMRLATPWRDEGPSLPIEFARKGDGGELATVLCPGATAVPVLWALFEDSDLQGACEQLRLREQIPAERRDGIGATPVLPGMAPGPYGAGIAAWAQRERLDAVIWTALPPRSRGIEGRVPSVDEAIAYLKGLSGDIAEHAEDYVRRVPLAISTVYRAEIERCLGWKPRSP